MFFTNWMELECMYTEYCMECEEKGIEPKDRKTWYNEME